VRQDCFRVALEPKTKPGGKNEKTGANVVKKAGEGIQKKYKRDLVANREHSVLKLRKSKKNHITT